MKDIKLIVLLILLTGCSAAKKQLTVDELALTNITKLVVFSGTCENTKLKGSIRVLS